VPEGPLSGITVLVTRAEEQAPALADPLAALGATIVLTPAIRFEGPDDWSPADAALRQAAAYHWAIFTSVNAVHAVTRRLPALGLAWSDFGKARVAAIGPATADALAAIGVPAGLVPDTYQAEGILAALEGEPMRGKRILLARAAKARDVLPDELRTQGAIVDVVPVYTTRPCDPSAQALAILDGRAGPEVVVTFTSSSTVSGFCDRLPEEIREKFRKCSLAAIGPITADELRRRGLDPRILPSEFTIPALVEAIRFRFAT